MSTPGPSKRVREKTPDCHEIEDGEISNPVTPLGKIHMDKQRKLGKTIDGQKIHDSLERNKMCTKRPAKVVLDRESEDSAEESVISDTFETSFASALARPSAGLVVSIRARGILESEPVLSKMAVSDRRDLMKSRSWLKKFNNLFSQIKVVGGSYYLDFFEELKENRISIKLYLKEYKDEKTVFNSLETVDVVYELFDEILSPVSSASALGQQLLAILSTCEMNAVYGQLAMEIVFIGLS